MRILTLIISLILLSNLEVKAQVDDLIEIAESNLPGKYRAQSLLKIYNDIESQEVVILPQPNKSMNSTIVDDDSKNEMQLFSIYPNPTSDYAYFTFKLPEEIGKSFMTVYDNSGKQLEVIDLSQVKNLYRLDVSNYSAGVYTVSFAVNEKLITTKSFVVQK